MSDDVEQLEPQDFVLRVRPFLKSDGSWNGEIDVSIITHPSNKLDDEDYYQMMHFCKMMASTIPIMEYNPDFREMVHAYVVEKVDKEYEVELEDKPVVTERDGNVIKLNFSTKTKGNA